MGSKKVLIIFLISSICLAGCQLNNPSEGQGEFKKKTEAPPEADLDSQPELSKDSQIPNQKNTRKILDVPVIHQKPELDNGCEVTSVTMLLNYAGSKVNKMELARKVKKDYHPLIQNKRGDIKEWGDPDEGFVGDITGKRKGYAINHDPLIQLMEQYLPGRIVNLSGEDIEQLEASIDQDRPVVVWATSHFQKPKRWEKWKKDGKVIEATFEEHAVLMVGYDENHVYINNPLTGEKGQKIKKDQFLESWSSLGKQAITYE